MTATTQPPVTTSPRAPADCAGTDTTRPPGGVAIEEATAVQWWLDTSETGSAA